MASILRMSWHQLKACTAHIAGFVHGIRILAICSCGGISQICQWYRVCDAGALRAEPLATLYIVRGHKHIECEVSLEVLEVDILWPRWVARIGVTRSTQACFLAADRQCTELPLLRLPRLVHGFRGSDPMRQTRDLARVGWRGLAPFLPIGPRERPLACVCVCVCVRAFALARREAHAPRRGGRMRNDAARDAFRGPEIKLLMPCVT